MNGYAQLACYLVLGLVLGGVIVVLPQLLSPRSIGRTTENTYECGIDTVGSAWMRFSITYYVFALIFVAFEVDILYLFPVAVAYEPSGWRGLAEIAAFLVILSLAILYAWRKGVFVWKSHRAPQSSSGPNA
ncbi:MAG: NADH-quinone oxidoreductase subunit A [Deltaproteobacteria bacterium]|jgi:NADH-quinone oxidoreductase subunit A|nr:NADH-quinone oxidoreductase subunit A [Deltaproteobacteria bacterium]